MYNLIEYSKNCRKTAGGLWNYYRDDPNNLPLVLDDNSRPTNIINYNADPIINSASLKYKNSFIGKTSNSDNDNNNNVIEGVEIVVPLMYLSNFWRTFYMPLIDCEVSLTLSWPKNSILNDLITIAPVPTQGDNPARPAIAAPTGATFKMTDRKLYVSVVTLPAENDNKHFEQLKTGFKRTVKWNKHRSEMSNETKNNNLNYLIDRTFIY